MGLANYRSGTLLALLPADNDLMPDLMPDPGGLIPGSQVTAIIHDRAAPRDLGRFVADCHPLAHTTTDLGPYMRFYQLPMIRYQILKACSQVAKLLQSFYQVI